MHWISRERPKIDHITCAWLIALFIDTAPEFLFVAVHYVLSVARTTGAAAILAGVRSQTRNDHGAVKHEPHAA